MKLRLTAFSIGILAVGFLLNTTNNLIAETKGRVSEKGKVKRSDAEWEKVLTPDQYKVLREKGTERAGSGRFNKHYEEGTYTCAGCGNTLFSSEAKYKSGCGWPSFTESNTTDAIEEKSDRSHGMVRTEVLCNKCGGHLGHVFNDGPAPNRLRYCINSAALYFNKEGEVSSKQEMEMATFGAGCFWCSEAVLEQIDGVKSVRSGYSGGKTKNPTYKSVCGGYTGHAEVVQVHFDPSVISYEEILKWFWKMHDPTTKNRQGADRGTQYRSIVLYHSAEQKKTAEQLKSQLDKTKVFPKKIVTEIKEYKDFYPAEAYHQDYYKNNKGNTYCKRVIVPKLEKLNLD